MKLVFRILTLFPGVFEPFLEESILHNAIVKGLADIELINFRIHGVGKNRQVDDSPYGGGSGMVLKPEPIVDALEELDKKEQNQYRILITPKGKPWSQSLAKEMKGLETPLTLICGRYEGFDDRIRNFVDKEISLGDFILLGGEVVAMAMIESIVRLIPGVLGNDSSLAEESFNNGLLEYAHFTRPPIFRGLKVPKVLLSGNHRKIEEWRTLNSLDKTRKKRTDLWKQFTNK